MRKIFKRFASLLTIFILTIMSIVPVHASENTSVVNVTDDLAIQMAERFAKGIGENSNIVANNLLTKVSSLHATLHIIK